MTTIKEIFQNTFQNQSASVAFPFDRTRSEVEGLIRKTLAEIHLQNAPSYTCKLERVEICDRWTPVDIIEKIKLIPSDTWKRLAIFTSVVIISYFFHSCCTSYFSWNFIIGSAIMIGALYKTFQYAKNSSFPTPIKAYFSYQNYEATEHEKLANETNENGIIDPVTLDVIPLSEANSPRCIHLSNWILEAKKCIYGLLEKSELTHPITPQKNLDGEERSELISQICRVFNLTSDQFESCWSDFKLSKEEKTALLEERYVKDGVLTDEVLEIIKRECNLLFLEIQAATRDLLEPSIIEFRQRQPDLFLQFQFQVQRCTECVTENELVEQLALVKVLLNVLEPAPTTIRINDHDYHINLRPSIHLLLLKSLHNTIKSHFTEDQLVVLNCCIEDEVACEENALKELMRVTKQERMVFLFSATAFFQNIVHAAEAKRRHEKFTSLTGIDLPSEH